MTVICHPSATRGCTESGSVVSVSSCRSGMADAPRSHLFSRLSKPLSLSLSLQDKYSSLHLLGGPPQNLLHFVNIFPVLWGGNHFSQSGGCAACRTAQVAVSCCCCQAHGWFMPSSLPNRTPQSLSSEQLPCQTVRTNTAAGPLPSQVRDLVFVLAELYTAPVSPFLQPALVPRDGSSVPRVWCHPQT